MFGRETDRQRRVKTHLVVTTSALSDVLPDLRHASPGALPARCSSGWPPLLASIDVNKSAVSPGRPLSAELFGPHLEQGPLRGAMRMLSREGFMYFWYCRVLPPVESNPHAPSPANYAILEAS